MKSGHGAQDERYEIEPRALLYVGRMAIGNATALPKRTQQTQFARFSECSAMNIWSGNSMRIFGAVLDEQNYGNGKDGTLSSMSWELTVDIWTESME